MNGVTKEAVRQRREAFDQLKLHDSRWFNLRLLMGYCAVLLLFAVLVLCTVVLLRHRDYPATVVVAASTNVFVDLVAMLFAVWKIILTPSPAVGLSPTITYEED